MPTYTWQIVEANLRTNVLYVDYHERSISMYVTICEKEAY